LNKNALVALGKEMGIKADWSSTFKGQNQPQEVYEQEAEEEGEYEDAEPEYDLEQKEAFYQRHGNGPQTPSTPQQKGGKVSLKAKIGLPPRDPKSFPINAPPAPRTQNLPIKIGRQPVSNGNGRHVDSPAPQAVPVAKTKAPPKPKPGIPLATIILSSNSKKRYYLPESDVTAFLLGKLSINKDE
jgi:hypothetical protein